MVFPSLSFSVDTGLVSQMSTLVVIGFSIVLNYWKKITLYAFAAISLSLISYNAFAIAAVQNNCGGYGYCQNTQNYYGQPWGYNRPVYYYPQLQYHSFWGPTPNYFRPHGASPYAPSWYNNCPHCNQGNSGWNTILPQQNQYHGPGVPAS